MFQCRNIRKSYHSSVVALNDVSLEVAPGEIFGIIGTSGAGKSTLLRMANGLEVPDSGDIIVNGRDINKISAEELKSARQEIGRSGFFLSSFVPEWQNLDGFLLST